MFGHARYDTRFDSLRAKVPKMTRDEIVKYLNPNKKEPGNAR